MKTRNSRLYAIRQIIKENHIGSQEALLAHLQRLGFPVTQATLSRDLRYLQVSKIPDAGNGFYYSLPTVEQQKETEKSFFEDIRRGFISLDFSYHLAVLKTLPGHANSVAFALDNLEIDGILGTMAGDDTILIVFQEGEKPENFKARLFEKIPDLEMLL